jgi:hypothetical protein
MQVQTRTDITYSLASSIVFVTTAIIIVFFFFFEFQFAKLEHKADAE